MGCPVRVAALTRAFLLCDGEAATAYLLGEVLIDIGHHFLEGGGVEPLAQNGSPADDVLTGLQLLGVAGEHLGLDFISQGFGFSLGFLDQGFQLLQGFDLGCDFDSRHSVDLLCNLNLLPSLRLPPPLCVCCRGYNKRC